jgi:hypothetical protein
MKQYELATYFGKIRILDHNNVIYISSKRSAKTMSFDQAHISHYKYYSDIIITKKLVQLYLSKDSTTVKMIEEILINKINDKD